MGKSKLVTALDAVTATTVSDVINIKYAKKVTFLFRRADHVAGSSIFSIQSSIDGETYKDDATMIPNSPNSASQNVVREISRTLTSNDTKHCALDLENFCYESIKVKVTEVTDGTHTCKCLVEY